MAIQCECGASLNLPATGAAACGIDFKMVQVLAFVDLDNMPTVGTENPTQLSLRSNIVDKTNWSAAITATKVSLSPMVSSPTSTPGEPQTWGGGDVTETEEYIGTEDYTFECDLPHCTTATAAALAEMKCLAQSNRLGVYLFTTEGHVIGKDYTASTASDSVVPIKVKSLHVGDRTFGNKTNPDLHHMSLKFEPEWSFDLGYEECDKVGGVSQDWRGLDLLS